MTRVKSTTPNTNETSQSEHSQWRHSDEAVTGFPQEKGSLSWHQSWSRCPCTSSHDEDGVIYVLSGVFWRGATELRGSRGEWTRGAVHFTLFLQRQTCPGGWWRPCLHDRAGGGRRALSPVFSGSVGVAATTQKSALPLPRAVLAARPLETTLHPQQCHCPKSVPTSTLCDSVRLNENFQKLSSPTTGCLI